MRLHADPTRVVVRPFHLAWQASGPDLERVQRLAREISALDMRTVRSELGADPSPDQLRSAHQAAQNAEQVLVAFIVKPAAWHQFGLPGQLAGWLKQLCAQHAVVAACLGAPQGLDSLPDASTHICTFSDVPASQQALVEKLLGRRRG